MSKKKVTGIKKSLIINEMNDLQSPVLTKKKWAWAQKGVGGERDKKCPLYSDSLECQKVRKSDTRGFLKKLGERVELQKALATFLVEAVEQGKSCWGPSESSGASLGGVCVAGGGASHGDAWRGCVWESRWGRGAPKGGRDGREREFGGKRESAVCVGVQRKF